MRLNKILFVLTFQVLFLSSSFANEFETVDFDSFDYHFANDSFEAAPQEKSTKETVYVKQSSDKKKFLFILKRGNKIINSLTFAAAKVCKKADGVTYDNWTFFKGASNSWNIKSLDSVIGGNYNIFNSSICGSSNILSDIGLYNSYVSNINVETLKSINISGKLIGSPEINVNSSKPFTINGDYKGSITIDNDNNFSLSGMGAVSITRTDEGTFPQYQRTNLILDGFFSLSDVNWININANVKGSLAIKNYYSVNIGDSSNRNSLDGNSTFDGISILQSGLTFSGSLKGNATVTGSAMIYGNGYTSLNLSYPFVIGIGEYIRIFSGGGAININGASDVNITNAKGFSMSHNCDQRVSVLIANPPDNLTLDPEGTNKGGFLYCTFEGGMKCEDNLAPPCHRPNPI